MKTVFLALYATAFGMFANTTFAQEAKNFSVVAAYFSGGNVYVGASSAFRFAPSISYESDSYKISIQDGVAYKILDNEGFKLSAALSPRFAPYDSTDSAALADMTRKMTIDAKLSGAFDIIRGSTLKVSYSTELTSKHGGSLLDLAISQFFPIGGQPFIFSLGTKRHDSKLAHYKFGVKDTEATASRAVYAPGATNLTYVSVNTFYDLSRTVSAFANVTANFLPNEATRSPIVSKSETVTAIIGLAYRF
jgi:outer membrane protein